MTTGDYISRLALLVDETVTDTSGSFSFILELVSIRQFTLQVGYYETVLFLEPGRTYRMETDTLHFRDVFRPFYNLEPLDFALVTSGEEPDINALIDEFDRMFDTFLLDHFNEIYRRGRVALFDSLLVLAALHIDENSPPFFIQHVQYRLADAELSMMPARRNDLFGRYLRGRDFLYDHPSFMEFFHKFYDQYLTMAGSGKISLRDLEKTVNELGSYPALMDSLGKDTLLRNEVLREMVMLKSLRELFYTPGYHCGQIIHILEEVAEISKFQKHREIAHNLVTMLTRMRKGWPAPMFHLPDMNGDTVSLDDLSGLPVYLAFFTSWSYASVAELDTLHNLYPEFDGVIRVVAVALDDDTGRVGLLLKDRHYPWVTLRGGESFDLIQNYGVRSFPLFILLDEQGRVLQYPAVKPSEGVRRSFLNLKEKKEAWE
ncbi:MAG: TlpA family protein disulfide reductase [Bacteroidales bacterium]|nr:TlpA family protein disulfide reductase [Bacteroidales bacterium]